MFTVLPFRVFSSIADYSPVTGGGTSGLTTQFHHCEGSFLTCFPLWGKLEVLVNLICNVVQAVIGFLL